MEPFAPEILTRLTRRGFLAGSLLLAGGCSSPWLSRGQSPDPPEIAEAATRLVGDVAVPFGMRPVEVSAVALVTGLPGTGSDAPPSVERSMLMEDMKRRGVAKPHTILKDSSTAVVMVRGYLRPGIQRGDRFDMELNVPDGSETESLRGGWMLEARLREIAVIQGQVRTGRPLALATGPIVVDPVDPSKPEETQLRDIRGRVLGGGVALQSRPLGLRLKSDHQSFSTSARIGDVVSRRFHTFVGGRQEGVAVPKTNEFVEIAVHPRYKDNVQRYLQVIRSIPLRETASSRAARFQLLEQQLLDPLSAGTAALRLEAIGNEAIDTLLRGLDAQDAGVRFFAAEALAYLNDSHAARPLAAAARDLPEFRVFALTALSAMDDAEAREQLVGLLSAASAETRYGAFRALWAMNENDPLVAGELLAERFHLHSVDVPGPPMVHVTRSFRPEVVLFGRRQRMRTPVTLNAGRDILVTSHGGSAFTVTRIVPGSTDRREVPAEVAAVVRAIAEVGGNYSDVLDVLQQATERGVLEGRFEVDALPEGGRMYRPEPEVAGASESAAGKQVSSNPPQPNLFASDRGAGL